ESPDGTIWIGTERGGLNKFKDGKFSRFTVQDGLSDNSIFSIAEDKEGKLWLGTGTGLDYLEGNRVVNYSKGIKALSDRIHCLLIDYEGLLWIGSEGNGLFKMRDPKFTVYGETEGLPRDDIWSVLEARDGSIWMGLGEGGGLARMKNGKIQSWSTKNGLPDNEVLSLYETKNGEIWAGTSGGLCQFINGKFLCYTTKHGLAHDSITAIGETEDGSLWIGTYKGVTRFKDGRFDNSRNEKGLGGSLIGDLMVARDGSVWLVAMPGGAFQIKDGTIKNYSVPEGLSSDQTTSIYEDAAGDMWIGTYNKGLCRLRPDGKITTYSIQQGLLESQVFDTIEDGLGNFWLTSNHGIFRLAKRQFDDLDQGKIKQLTPVRYGISDGMRSEECNGGSQPSSWKTRDGRILITTIRGLVTFNPREIADESFLLQATIQEILADKVSIPLDADIRLGPGLLNLEIHYSGLSLIAPTKVQFKYMLEGWDKDWIEVGGRRAAYYTNLPPNDYLFRVSVANAAGQWGETNTGIAIHIKKRFYQRTWFYLLSAAFVGFVFFAVFRFRVSRLNEKLLSKITMSMPVAVCVIDSKSSVKLINNQFVRDLGYTIEDLADLSKWFEQIYPDPDLLHKANINWRKAMTATSASEILSIPREWRVRRKDGAELDLEVRLARAGDRFILTFTDITYRKRAEEILKNSREQLRELAARLQQAREEERAYIAREIHDELGQLLTGLKIDLKWLEKRLPQGTENSALLRNKMVLILELVDETILAMRRVATHFRPGVLDTLGLIAAIEWQAEEFSSRTGIVCEFDHPMPQQLTANEYDTALFRIFQESLTNVARHSEATAVRIKLSRQNGSLVLQIRDNGRGITEKEMSDPHSIGLLGMRERAHIFGGEVSVAGHPGKGT
ncbi:MAG: two-component regulator propeller domain-containing protein, partial [Acidobacteriota bacterium]